MKKRKIYIRILELIIIFCTLYFLQRYIGNLVYNLRDNINNTYELNIQFKKLSIQFVGVFSVGAILATVISIIEEKVKKYKE